MSLTDIANLRLFSQQIAETTLKTAKDIVAWMGAMQAQDFAMAKWAIGIRLPNSSEQVVERAINDAEIIRTHLLRPTWHFVSADDIYWMLELSAPRINALLRSRHEELELTETVFTKSNLIIEKVLSDGKHLLREELIAELAKAKISTDDNRAHHLILRAELDGIVCSGATNSGKHTYALLEERVPKTKPLTKEEALASLAIKYFSSHGPATRADFVWWSGLSARDAQRALESVKSDFISEIIDSHTYWFANSASIPETGKERVYLLPAYDEFIISYRDRRAMLTSENYKKSVSNNGVFRPVIVVNGQVTGIWKRSIKKDKVVLETEFFKQPNQTTLSLIDKAATQYGHFLEKRTEIIYRKGI